MNITNCICGKAAGIFCSECTVKGYCSEKCQMKDSTHHKENCDSLRQLSFALYELENDLKELIIGFIRYPRKLFKLIRNDSRCALFCLFINLEHFYATRDKPQILTVSKEKIIRTPIEDKRKILKLVSEYNPEREIVIYVNLGFNLGVESGSLSLAQIIST